MDSKASTLPCAAALWWSATATGAAPSLSYPYLHEGRCCQISQVDTQQDCLAMSACLTRFPFANTVPHDVLQGLNGKTWLMR